MRSPIAFSRQSRIRRAARQRRAAREASILKKETQHATKSDSVTGAVEKRRQKTDGGYDTKARGLAVLNSPLLNKGAAFTPEERKQLGLTGLLPPDISTLRTQVQARVLALRAAPGRAEQERLSYRPA